MRTGIARSILGWWLMEWIFSYKDNESKDDDDDDTQVAVEMTANKSPV